MSLSQRLVSILSAPFCGSLSLEAPSQQRGARRGRAGPSTEMAAGVLWAGRSRVEDEPTSSLGCCLPTASNKQSEPTFPVALCPFCPGKVPGGEQAHGEGVTLGEQRTRLGVCSEGGQETTGKSCCSVLGAEETTGHWISASLARLYPPCLA